MPDPVARDILQIGCEETAFADVLHLRGEVDLLSAPSLREHLMQLVGRARPIIVDCSELQFLDMSGIHIIEDCERRVREAGRRFVLVGSMPIVHKILTIVELGQRIRIADTMEEALGILAREGTNQA